MPGDFIRRLPQFTFEQFDAFREELPKEEKWARIDGVSMMMPLPTLVYLRITRNIERLVNARFQAVRPEWNADTEIGLRLPDDGRYNPEPVVTVIDTEIELRQIYAERFSFVAEVLSESSRPGKSAGSNRPIVLAAKIDFYKLHDHCRGVFIVRQDRIEAELYLRTSGRNVFRLASPADRIVIDEIGDTDPLAALLRHTPQQQSAWITQ